MRAALLGFGFLTTQVLFLFFDSGAQKSVLSFATGRTLRGRFDCCICAGHEWLGFSAFSFGLWTGIKQISAYFPASLNVSLFFCHSASKM